MSEFSSSSFFLQWFISGCYWSAEGELWPRQRRPWPTSVTVPINGDDQEVCWGLIGWGCRPRPLPPPDKRVRPRAAPHGTADPDWVRMELKDFGRFLGSPWWVQWSSEFLLNFNSKVFHSTESCRKTVKHAADRLLNVTMTTTLRPAVGHEI